MYRYTEEDQAIIRKARKANKDKRAEKRLYALELRASGKSAEEAQEALNAEGVKVNHAHIKLLHPFPAEEMSALMDKAKKVIVIENNATGQLANIMKMSIGGHAKMKSILKYDGTPFLPRELTNLVKEEI